MNASDLIKYKGIVVGQLFQIIDKANEAENRTTVKYACARQETKHIGLLKILHKV